MKKPKPMQTRPITGVIQKMDLDDVQPKMKSPAVKNTEPIIIGGRRASGTALLPFASNFRM